jgi:hypothetical protein
MRRVILFIVLLGVVCASSAQLSPDELAKLRKKRMNNYAITATMVFFAGAADGLNQALMYHYGEFKTTFPGANDQFWKPSKSGANKYKNGDPRQGAKFPGSTTWAVFLTDGYHLTRFTDHLLWSGAIALKFSCHEKKRWYMYFVEAAGYWMINRVGFCMTYNQFKGTP